MSQALGDAYVLWLPGVQTDTLNVSLRKHWRARGQATRALAWEIRAAVGRRGLPCEPLPRAHVLIERLSSGNAPDTDGLIGGCKGLIDCLLPFHETRRRYGLGFVQDDNPACMLIEVRAARVKPAEKGMRITITPIGAGS